MRCLLRSRLRSLLRLRLHSLLGWRRLLRLRLSGVLRLRCLLGRGALLVWRRLTVLWLLLSLTRWLLLRLALRLVRLLATLFCLELLWRLPEGLLTLCRILRLLELAVARGLALASSRLFSLSRISVGILVHALTRR